MRPQTFNDYFRDGGSCAVGAATEAIYWSTNDYAAIYECEHLYGYVQAACAFCPVCSEESSISYVIRHLNDHHKWTREAIADWLETEEEKLGFVLISDEVSTQPVNDRKTEPVESREFCSASKEF